MHTPGSQTDRVEDSALIVLVQNLMNRSLRLAVLRDFKLSEISWVDESAPKNTTGEKFLTLRHIRGLT